MSKNVSNQDRAVVKKYGKRYASAASTLTAQEYGLGDAVAALKQVAAAKFDETMEMAFNLGVDPRHADQTIRGVVNLPHGTGKKIRVAVIAGEAKLAEAREAGADLVGGEDLINSIKSGVVDFDRCIATPDMMGKLGVVARILGPKGLMPNPKLGTVSVDVAAAVKAAKSGSVEYRVEKQGIIHVGVGKVSFEASQLVENAMTVVQAILKAKPVAAKGTYMKSVYMTTTMGPSVKLAVGSLYA